MRVLKFQTHHIQIIEHNIKKMTLNIQYSVSEISKKYNQYRSSMLDNWEISRFLDHYLTEIIPLIKSKSIKKFDLDSFQGSKTKPKYKKYDTSDLMGVISRITDKSLPYRTVLESVFLTEDYAQNLTRKVLTDFPGKLPSVKNEDDLLEGRYHKLLHMLITIDSKEEIFNKIIEEKVRGLFYGNPVDFFKLDKAQLGFGTEFKDNFKKSLELYSEIIARRNIIVHNNGKVDRKYLREVKETTYKLNEKVKISPEYIKDSIKVLVGMSTIATDLVLTKVYKVQNKSTLMKSITRDLKTLAGD